LLYVAGSIFIRLLGLTAHDTVYQRLESGASIDLG
jgi:hypothetical protein